MPDTLPIPAPKSTTELHTISAQDLTAALSRSRAEPRRRTNLNVHGALEDPVQRLFNVLQPGTYIRPHRHEQARWELFVILKGCLGIVTFDEQGFVLERVVLTPDGVGAVEIAGGAWHTAVALEPDTVLFEVKPGPYRKPDDKDLATWSPAEGDPRCPQYLEMWEEAVRRAAG
jgi:cupin fold WbuC family metalloprotein